MVNSRKLSKSAVILVKMFILKVPVDLLLLITYISIEICGWVTYLTICRFNQLFQVIFCMGTSVHRLKDNRPLDRLCEYV